MFSRSGVTPTSSDALFRFGARMNPQIPKPPAVHDRRPDAITVNTSIARCTRHLLPAIAHLPPAVAAERGSQIAGFIVRACADQARLMGTGTPARTLLTVEDFTLNLTDTVLAILQAPTSVKPHPSPRETPANPNPPG